MGAPWDGQKGGEGRLTPCQEPLPGSGQPPALALTPSKGELLFGAAARPGEQSCLPCSPADLGSQPESGSGCPRSPGPRGWCRRPPWGTCFHGWRIAGVWYGCRSGVVTPGRVSLLLWVPADSTTSPPPSLPPPPPHPPHTTRSRVCRAPRLLHFRSPAPSFCAPHPEAPPHPSAAPAPLVASPARCGRALSADVKEAVPCARKDASSWNVNALDIFYHVRRAPYSERFS